MELTYDWNCFQSMFYPKRRPPASHVVTGNEAASPIYLVVEDQTIISAYGEGEDFSPWVGMNYTEMASQVAHRELVLFERKEVDRWIHGAMALPHFYDQVEFLRENANPQILSRGKIKKAAELPVYRHFLLEGLRSWWAKFLPSSYGIFIRLEGEAPRDLVLVVRRGRVDSFCEPDLTILGRERSKQPADIVKYLSEKHLVPVQGVFVRAEQWHEWLDTEDPWRKVAFALKAEEVRLEPFNWGVATLIASRGILGF